MKKRNADLTPGMANTRATPRRGKQKDEEGYGQGVVTLSLDDDVLLDEDALTARLLEVFADPSYQPPTLPSIATELMTLSQDPNANIDSVANLLEQDAFIAGRVMKIVRSPVYLSASEVPSLQNAVMRLGLDTLRDIVLEICMNLRVFQADAYTDTMERLRQHATFVGHVSRMLCRTTGLDSEYAFLCGLLHDVGIAGSLIALCEGTNKELRPDLIAAWPAIDRAHGEAGSLMVKLWDLPPAVRDSVKLHHQVWDNGAPDSMAAVVCLADELAHELGFSVVAPEGDTIDGVEDEFEAACLQSHTAVDRSTPKTLERCREVLRLSDEDLEGVRERAGTLAEALKDSGG